MPIAVHDPIGKAHDDRGRLLLNDFAATYGWEIHHGPADQPAPIDAILTKQNKIISVVEGRTRITHTLSDLERMGNTYLVTHQKLLDLMKGGELLGVPSFLVVELACGTRYAWCIGDAKGNSCFDWEVEWTKTRATSLDDRHTSRANAFLPFRCGTNWTFKTNTTESVSYEQ